MKVAVVGAGAIGAYVGAALSRAGTNVTLVARGEHGNAMRAHGVRVHSEHGDFTAHPAVTDDLTTIGPVDAVILTLKAHQIGAIAATLPSLFHDDTTVISIQNGLPWWYFQRLAGPYDGMTLESIDPGGRIAAAIASERVIGSVAYAASELEAPGVVRHIGVTRFLLGEPDRTASARLTTIASAFESAGLDTPISNDIRAEIWLKLLGNTSFNPISALTRATLVDMANDPLVAELAREMMTESVAILTQLGVTLAATVDERIDRARRVGPHKTSMLQDLEAGRPMEIDALLGSIVELGARLDIPTPATGHVYALLGLLAKQIRPGALHAAHGDV
jgi:2-dehydropantoate 2-reductase